MKLYKSQTLTMTIIISSLKLYLSIIKSNSKSMNYYGMCAFFFQFFFFLNCLLITASGSFPYLAFLDSKFYILAH